MDHCPKRCPGCRHRDLSTLESEGQKLAFLRHKLQAWADRVEAVRSHPSVANYRGKACLRTHWSGEGWEFGFLAGRYPQQEFIPIHDCPVHTEVIRRAMHAFSRCLPGPDHFPMVFLVISGQLATLVLKAKAIPDAKVLPIAELAETSEQAGLTGLFVNLNPAAGERVLSSRGWHKIWGEDRAWMEWGGRKLIYGPDSFQQLIPQLHEQAIGEARRFLIPDQDRSGVRGCAGVMDLYCGIGTTLSEWRKAGARRIIGIELSGEAVRCARMNAGLEGVLQGKVADRIPQLDEWLAQLGTDRGSGPVLAFVNPPRLGLEPEVCQWLARTARPARIAYLSCSAGTLLRDLKVLCDAGYGVQRIIPYDFFPRTHHVETLALLELDPDSRVLDSTGSRRASGIDG